MTIAPIISRLFVVVVVATLPSSSFVAETTTKLRVVVIFTFGKCDDVLRSEKDIKLEVARGFNKDEDGTQDDAFIVLSLLLLCVSCMRVMKVTTSLDTEICGKSPQKKDAHETTLLCPFYILLSRDEQLRRERQKQQQKQREQQQCFAVFFIILRVKSFCPTTTERGEKKTFEKKISLTAIDDDDDVLLRVVAVRGGGRAEEGALRLHRRTTHLPASSPSSIEDEKLYEETNDTEYHECCC